MIRRSRSGSGPHRQPETKNTMTKEESTPDFEHLLQEFPVTQSVPSPNSPSRMENGSVGKTRKRSTLKFSLDSVKFVQNGAVEAEEEMVSAEMTPSFLLENGNYENTLNSKNCDASNSHTEAIIRDMKPTAEKSSRKRKSKPVKLQKASQKPITRSLSSSQPSKLEEPVLSPSTNCPVPIPVATTDTMIQSIPDLFKNASIGMDTLPIINGPIPSMAYAEPNEDLATQISTSVLPPFAPPVPPERFNMPDPQRHCCIDCGDQFWVESSLAQHLQRRSIYITFNCATCKKLLVFYNRCTLLGHVRVHHERSQAADIQQASVSPLPHELIQCIQDQKAAGGAVSSPTTNSTPVVTIIIPPNSDHILTVTKPNQKQGSKCKCPECHYQCGSFLGLQEHLGCSQTSPAESGAQCPQCNMVCPSRCSLLCHQRIHVQSRPYLCPECGQNPTETWDDFQRHLAIECMHYSRTIGFKCLACGLLVVSPEQLRQHVIETHSEYYFKCQACPMAFRAQATFDAHRKTEHQTNNLQFTTIQKCPLCEVVFQSNDVLHNHLEDHLQEALKASKFLFICLECNHLFEEKSHLGQHLQSSHGELFNNGAAEDPTDKRQLKLPRKRTHPISKSKAPPGKVSIVQLPEPAVPKPIVQNVEPLKIKAHKNKVLKSKVLKSKSELQETSSRQEPRIPPLVLSLKDHAPKSGNSPTRIIKKIKIAPDPVGTITCEDCRRTFTTEIGCRVHRQRSHSAPYKYKSQLRLTLERRSRRPAVQERIQAHRGTSNEKTKHLEDATFGKCTEQDRTLDVPSEPKTRPSRRPSLPSATTCKECARSFRSSQECSAHQQQCLGGADKVKSKCAVCLEHYPDSHSMAVHGQKHLKAGTLVCTLCNNLAFGTKMSLSKHIENHASNMTYPVSCALCSEELSSAEPAIEHWRKEHGLKSFHCPKCAGMPNAIIYLYKKSLNRHIQKAHGATKSKKVCVTKGKHTYACSECDVDPFLTSALLKKHMEKDHPIAKDLNDVSMGVETPLTEMEHGENIAETPVIVKTERLTPEPVHAQDEHEPTSQKAIDGESVEYSCAKCNFKSRDRPVFQNHIKCHKTESDSYQCLECGTSFVVEPSLRKHLKCTHKVKNLEAYLVDRGYAIGAVVHNGELNEGASSGNTINGSQSDMKINPLACTICFSSFENELALKTHSRTHGMAFIRSKRGTCTNSQSSEQTDTPPVTPTKDDG